MKICDYQNHRRFSLRCLGNGIIPVSIRLKNNVRTQRSDNIIQRAERSLVNERIREVNITLDQLKHDTYMYESRLSAIITQEHTVGCKEYLKNIENRDTGQSWRDKKRNISSYGIRNTRAAIVAMVQVATQTRKKFQDQYQYQMLGCEFIQPTFISGSRDSPATWTKFCGHPNTPLPRIHNSSRGGMPKP